MFVLVVRERRLDDTLRVIDDGLDRIGLTRNDEFDATLCHTDTEPLPCPTCNQRGYPIDRVKTSPELVKRHFLAQVQAVDLARRARTADIKDQEATRLARMGSDRAKILARNRDLHF